MNTTLERKGFSIKQGDETRIMGIINVTPDSFFDGGSHNKEADAIEHGLRLTDEGAHILDVGGESTRPGAEEISTDEEIARVIPIIAELSARTTIPISVDTRKSKVAAKAVEAGATMINDVSAGLFDPEILDVAAETGCHYIAMHMRGTPETMQDDTRYDGLVNDILEYFEERIQAAIKARIPSSKIILDPGIGFGKSPEQNYTLIGRAGVFRTLGYPLLIGPSRKSYLNLIGANHPDLRLPGTLATVTICAATGVELVRVHDVAPALQAIKVAIKVRKSVHG